MSRIVWSTLDRASAGSFHDQGCRLELLTALSCDDWQCCRKFAVNPDLSLQGGWTGAAVIRKASDAEPSRCRVPGTDSVFQVLLGRKLRSCLS